MPDSPPVNRPITRPYGSQVPDNPDLAAGTRLGDWIVDAKIGEGGMGTVYAAVHAEIGKRAAIKVIRASLAATEFGGDRFVGEARAVNQVEHPNIIDIFHIGWLPDGRPYLVMELLRGETLGDRLANNRVLVADALDLLLQICSALAAAHAKGVIHRDLKPENIFLSKSASGTRVKLVDWGIAKLTAPGLSSGTVTRSGVLVGTPQYMSPEQARGKHVDAATDIYSLGAIAYELLLEGPPFAADNIADLITMHLREPVPPPSDLWPDIPPALESLLVRMLAKEAADRPPIDEVAATLAAVRNEVERLKSQRQRLATGSQPPPLRDFRTSADTLPAIPAASAIGSGPMQTVDPETLGLDDTEDDLPVAAPVRSAPRRRRWVAAAGALLACATLALVVITTSRSDHRADDATPPPPVPAPATAVPAPSPAPTPAPAPPPGIIELRVTPPTARIQLDGADVAAVDGLLTRTLAPGTHALIVEAPGHLRATRTLEVSSDTTLRLDVALVRERHKPARKPASRSTSTTPIDPDGTVDPYE